MRITVHGCSLSRLVPIRPPEPDMPLIKDTFLRFVPNHRPPTTHCRLQSSNRLKPGTEPPLRFPLGGLALCGESSTGTALSFPVEHSPSPEYRSGRDSSHSRGSFCPATLPTMSVQMTAKLPCLRHRHFFRAFL